MAQLQRGGIVAFAALTLAGCLGSGPASVPAPTATTASSPSPATAKAPFQATIVTRVDFSRSPFGGTLEVTRGADELGCSTGTFVDSQAPEGIEKTITCTDGVPGTFTIRARTMTQGCKPGPPEECRGSWTVHRPAPTGGFVGLQGFGDFTVAFTEAEAARETLSGEFRFE